jgi:putative SOS response-associated peptidase YedK
MLGRVCGRFTLTMPSAPELARILGVEPSEAFSLLYRPRWNVAPTDPHWVVRLAPQAGGQAGDATGLREIAPASWGVAPPPAKDGAKRPPLINARSETVARMPGVRDAFAARAADRGRCIVPVDGFYEWVGEPKHKRPIWFSARDGDLLRFAGLWEPAPSGDGLRFTILTTAANDIVAQAHDRMPVILAPGDVDAWLRADPEVAAGLLGAAPPGTLSARAVIPRANSVKNDDPSCLDPWDPTLEIDLRTDAEPGNEKESRMTRPRKRGARAASKNPTPSLFGATGVDPVAPSVAVPTTRRKSR